MIYYFVLLMLAFLTLPSTSAERRSRGLLAILLLVIFGGLRYEVGTDWLAYKDLFDAVTAGEPYSSFREENGFLTLTFFISSIYEDFEFFIFSLFVLSLGLKVTAVKLYNTELNAALLIYFSAVFLIYDVNGLRQGLAMGLVLLAGCAAYRHRAITYIVLLAIASSVHIISLIALPIYAMTRKMFFLENAWRRLGLLATGCILSYIAAIGISSSALSQYLQFANLSDRYDYYVDAFSGVFSPLGLGSVQRIFVATTVVFTIDSVRAPVRLKTLLYNCHAVALFMYYIFSFNMEFMARISFYYKCFDIITLSLILSSQREGGKRFLYLLFLTALSAAQVFQILSIPDGGLIPYQNAFKLW